MTNTVIFKWNPAISSYSMLEFLDDIRLKIDDGDWSVHDYNKIQDGDRFYMLKVGKGQTGIVKRGRIITAPFTDEDWSRLKRTTYYCEYRATIMINPDTFPLLTSEQLQQAIPNFDWFGGHSGVVLDPAQANKLERVWKKYISDTQEEFHARLELLEKRDNMINDQLFWRRRTKRNL